HANHRHENAVRSSSPASRPKFAGLQTTPASLYLREILTQRGGGSLHVHGGPLRAVSDEAGAFSPVRDGGGHDADARDIDATSVSNISCSAYGVCAACGRVSMPRQHRWYRAAR